MVERDLRFWGRNDRDKRIYFATAFFLGSRKKIFSKR